MATTESRVTARKKHAALFPEHTVCITHPCDKCALSERLIDGLWINHEDCMENPCSACMQEQVLLSEELLSEIIAEEQQQSRDE